MNEEIKKRWIEALRSGEFKQGKGTLCQYVASADEYQYCCLGVLQEVVTGERPSMSTQRYRNANKSSDTDMLPLEIAEKAGFEVDEEMHNESMRGECGISLKIEGEVFHLSILNDGSATVDRMDFDGIADLIERADTIYVNPD